MDLNLHVCPEKAGLYGYPSITEQLAKAIDQSFSQLGRGRLVEAGTPPPAGTGQEGELAHDQGLSAHFQERQIELALSIGENAEVGRLSGQEAGIGLSVSLGHPQENHQPPADLSQDTALSRHAGARDPLEDCFQSASVLLY